MISSIDNLNDSTGNNNNNQLKNDREEKDDIKVAETDRSSLSQNDSRISNKVKYTKISKIKDQIEDNEEDNINHDLNIPKNNNKLKN